MNKTIKLVFVILLFSLTALAHAKNNKPGVVFIHGLGNSTAIKYKSSKLFSKINWSKWKRQAFRSLETEEIIWTTKLRVFDQLDDIINQYKKILRKDHCNNGCIIVTHSTGGLIADILLSRSLESKGSNNDFSEIQESTILSIQIASALGGSSFATHAFSWLKEECKSAQFQLDPNINSYDIFYDPTFIKILTIPLGHTNKMDQELDRKRRLGKLMHSVFPGIDCKDVEKTAGIFYDLQPEIAREINGSDNTGVLTLMVAGDGKGYMGDLFTQFLLKPNDGMIEMHSACGANEIQPYESCVSYINASGETDRQYYAPDPASGFYANHYPFIMTEENHMGQVVSLISTKKEVVINLDELFGLNSFINTQNSKYIIDSQNGFKNTHLSKMFGKYFDFSKISAIKESIQK